MKQVLFQAFQCLFPVPVMPKTVFQVPYGLSILRPGTQILQFPGIPLQVKQLAYLVSGCLTTL